MSNQTGCVFCESSNPKREKNGKIRCERFSEWRDPLGNICESFFDRASAEMLERVRKAKEEEI